MVLGAAVVVRGRVAAVSALSISTEATELSADMRPAVPDDVGRRVVVVLGEAVVVRGRVAAVSALRISTLPAKCRSVWQHLVMWAVELLCAERLSWCVEG